MRHPCQTNMFMGAVLAAAILLPGLSFAATVGFNSPSANAADTGGDGNGYETTPANAYIADGVFAVDSSSGNGTGTSCTGTDKDRHRFYNYGFNLATGSTVQGIELQLTAKADNTNGAPQICAQFSWDGGATWTTTKTATLSKLNNAYTLGGTADTWGRAWAVSDFNNANFRVRLIDVASNTSRQFSLDYVGVRITYTPTVSFNAATSSGSETLSASDISVSLSTVSSQSVTVNWAVAAGGTATNVSDYSMLPNGATSGTLTFAPGEIRKTIRVANVRDDAVEGDETVKLTLSAPVNAILGSITSHTYSLYDSPPRNVAGDYWADVVLGQRDHTESTTNTVVPNHVFNASNVVVDRSPGSGTNGRAYVWDAGNNRILAFKLDTCYASLAGTACQPDLVIGQPSGSDWGSCNQDGSMSRYPYLAPASASTLCGASAWYVSPKEGTQSTQMAVDQTTGDLYVPDFENHRVLIFNNPFTDSTPAVADDVIGQDDFSGVYCNKNPYKRTGNGHSNIDPSTLAAPSASSLCAASDNFRSIGFGVALDATGNLWVADGGNNRVLRFSKDTVTHKIQKSADLVLGQADFITRTGGEGLNQMQGPSSLAFGPDGRLYVGDGLGQDHVSVVPNDRVLVFATPFSSGMAGTLFSGGGNTWFKKSHITGVSVAGAAGLWINSFIADVTTPSYIPQHWEVKRYDWNGVLLNTLPRWTAGANNFDGPVDADKLGNVLVPGNRDVSDVIVYKPSYTTQPTTLLPPWGSYNTTTDSHLLTNDGTGIAAANNQLIVADACRILIWNNVVNAQGQVQLTNGKSADSIIDKSLGYCYGQMKVDSDGRLWVMTKNNAILVFQTPLFSWSKPIKVITAPFAVLNSTEHVNNISSMATRDGGLVPTAHGEFLWISQPFQNRVLRIRNPLGSAPQVDVVLGQLNLTDTLCNRGTVSPVSGLNNLLCQPFNLSTDRNGNLYVSDHMSEGGGNLRMLRFDASAIPTTNTTVVYAPNASFEYPKYQATYEPAFDSTNRMVVGYDSYNGNGPFVGIYDNPLTAATPTCTHPAAEPDCYLNDHTLMAFAAAFDAFNNLYVVDPNRTKVFVYKLPFNNPTGAPPPPVYPPVSSRITAAADDAYTCGTTTSIDDWFGIFGRNTLCPGGAADSVAGLRFNNINVPPGATIDRAVIGYWPINPKTYNYTSPAKIKIKGVLTANPVAFNTGTPLTSLPTTSQANWVSYDDSVNGVWEHSYYHESTDLKAIVQEIVNQGGWLKWNSMAFLLSDGGITDQLERYFIAQDYPDSNDDRVPYLTIYYH